MVTWPSNLQQCRRQGCRLDGECALSAPTPRLGAALRTPQTLSVMPRLTEAFPEPWTAGPGLQSSLRAAPGLNPSRDTLLRTAVAQPSMGTETTESLGVEGFWFILLFVSLFLSSSSLITVGLFLLAFPYFLAVQDASGVQDAPSCLCPAPALEPAISPRSSAPSPGEWY